MKTILFGLAVGIAVVVAAAIFMSKLVLLALSIAKAARCRKPKYFNISYRPKYGTGFCRARLVGKVGKVDWLDNKVLYVVEIHPKDAAKAYAWTVQGAGLCGRQLLEKGRFYRYALKEELYD